MPWSGSAPNQTYLRSDGTRTGSAVNVTADGAGINNEASLADNRENDFATALSLCWKVDGGTQPSANLPMNSKKFTGMAQGSARTDSLRIDQVQDNDFVYATVGGTANAIELTTAPTCSPVEGMTIVFIPASDSTSTVTVDLNGNGAVALQYNAAALVGGEVQAGLPARITHDGTVWQLENSARLADLNALAKTDGNIIVGDGTNWVAESGATARTSLGLGTGNSPQFTGLEIGHASDTTLTRASAGNVSVEGNLLYRAGGTDVPITDGGTGSSTAAAARIALAALGAVSVQTFTANGTWTKPSNCKYILVIGTGGGAGGGDSNTTNVSVGGGGAGATAIELIDVSAISSETVTVGAGGAGGTSGGNGSNGGDTTFGAHFTAGGGNGNTSFEGGDGGTATGGSLNIAGGDGLPGGDNQISGGGGSFWGGGARGVSPNSDGSGRNASAYGAGGSGGSSTSSTAGGNGAGGVVFVLEFGS